MTTEVVRDLADTIIGNIRLSNEEQDIDRNASAETIITGRNSSNQIITASVYDLTADSVFSRDVDHWIRGDSAPTDTAVLRVATVQQSTVTSPSLVGNGTWLLAAMVLPFMSLHNSMLWRCTPSTVVNTAEIFVTQVAYLCARARYQLRRLAHEQAARDLFATAMDILLVMYALGFLVLTMSQANIIGR